MSEIIKMDCGMMREMAQALLQGATQLDETMAEMKSIAQALEGGALLGRGGDAFVDAINSKLSPSINRMKDKFEELAQDVLKAMEDMQSADTSTERMYK